MQIFNDVTPRASLRFTVAERGVRISLEKGNLIAVLLGLTWVNWGGCLKTKMGGTDMRLAEESSIFH